MVAFDNSYSRMVAWAKIILPLLALAILSTLFLASRSIDPVHSIPFSEVDVQELAAAQRVGGPVYSGVAKSGSSYTIIADTATPDLTGQSGMTATNIKATIETTSGTIIKVTAPDGVVEPKSDSAELSNGVYITTSTGFQFDTDVLFTKIDLSEIISKDQIDAKGPFGDFSAGKMAMTQQNDQGTGNDYLMVFTDGVNLIYIPQQ